MMALRLDPATLMFATALLAFITAGFSFTTLKALAGKHQGAEDWGWAMTTLGGALFLWSTTPPTSALFLLGDSLSVLTVVWFLLTFYQLTGKRLSRKASLALALLGVSGIVAYYFGLPRDVVVLTTAASQLVVVVASSWRLIRNQKTLHPAYCWVIVSVLFLFGGATTARIWITLFGQGAAAVIPVASSNTQILATSTLTMLIVVGSFGVFGILGERKRQQLLESSRRDALTGLYTRGAFFEFAQNALARRNSAYSLLMIDLDHFKSINDTYGHAAGDAVLRNAAKLILQSVRNMDIVGRYGGEEICVLLPGCESEAARNIAERIVSGIAEQVVCLPSGKKISYTTSLGYSSYELCEHDSSKPPKLEELLSAADEALYLAKKLGRNQIQLAPTFLLKDAIERQTVSC